MTIIIARVDRPAAAGREFRDSLSRHAPGVKREKGSGAWRAAGIRPAHLCHVCHTCPVKWERHGVTR